jgi:methylated-DNA-[protein]-cysteine S-methyltransferase
MTTLLHRFNTLYGGCQARFENCTLVELNFMPEPVAPTEFNDLAYKLQNELNEYFKGERLGFDIACAQQATAFQKQVYALLSCIPYGTTTTYQKIALQLGNKNKTRAVANAIGKNKIAIVVPCHRVIGNNGLFTGFKWGLGLKQRLLELEGHQKLLF